jgi:ABC-type uncharacterized transport system substrate-binding protein
MVRRGMLRFAVLTIALSAWLAPHALAQGKIWRIGFLDLNRLPTAEHPSSNLAFFKQGLGELGYREGENYVIEARFADLDRSRLSALAKELVERKVDVIVTIGTTTTRAAKKATATIPIVMAGSQNPVGNGFVASLAHPGGNVTGLTHNAGFEIAGKGLQLLKQTAPQISRVAVLADDSRNNPYINLQREIARGLDLAILVHELGGVRNADDFEAVLAAMVKERADAVFVYSDFVFGRYKDRFIQFSVRYRVPTIFQNANYVEAGGLMSYYTSFKELRRQAAGYVDKIFKGAKPGDLPVQQPSRFQFVVNLTTAKALGLTLPASILAFADRIIE